MNDLLKHAAELLIAVAGWWIGWRLKTPRDYERAQLLAQLAKDAASLVLSIYPNATWTELLRLVVTALANIKGVPTTDAKALERAASSALIELGQKPA